MSKKKEIEPVFAEVAERGLRFKYGNNVRIVPNSETDPTEIVCELEPTADHPEYSVAVAVIQQSLPHHHERSQETYKVLSGTIKLHLGEKALTLAAGKNHVIEPGTVHWAQSDDNAWVRVTSRPGWTPDDHIADELDEAA